MYRVAGSQSTRPQYQEIAERLQADILGGRWAVGDQLDPETTLADHHHVSRFTLRQALSLLEERGLVSRKRRVGTVVVRTNLPEIMVQQLSSMDELLQYPPQTRLETLKCDMVDADVALARLLGCAIGSRWARIQCIRHNPGHPPICWSDIYVPERCAEIGERIGKDGTPVYRLMENMFGLVAADIDAELFAGTLPAPKAKPLGVEPGSATLVIVRRYHDRDGQLFEVSVSEHPASRFSYSVALKRRAPEG